MICTNCVSSTQPPWSLKLSASTRTSLSSARATRDRSSSVNAVKAFMGRFPLRNIILRGTGECCTYSYVLGPPEVFRELLLRGLERKWGRRPEGRGRGRGGFGR